MLIHAMGQNTPIYSNKISKTYRNTTTNAKNISSDIFQPNFNGYNKLLNEAVSMNFTKDYQVEKSFESLIKELVSRTDLKRESAYYDIVSIYTERGFMGLLNELWKAYPQDRVAKMLNAKMYKPIELINNQSGISFELFHAGRFNYTIDSPKNIKVIFRDLNEKLAMEYSLNKHGELEICQTSPNRTVTTGFHLSTGNRKFEVFQPRNGNPETTYFNKNGEESFWKNFFLGGTTIIPQ